MSAATWILTVLLTSGRRRCGGVRPTTPGACESAVDPFPAPGGERGAGRVRMLRLHSASGSERIICTSEAKSSTGLPSTGQNSSLCSIRPPAGTVLRHHRRHHRAGTWREPEIETSTGSSASVLINPDRWFLNIDVDRALGALRGLRPHPPLPFVDQRLPECDQRILLVTTAASHLDDPIIPERRPACAAGELAARHQPDHAFNDGSRPT